MLKTSVEFLKIIIVWHLSNIKFNLFFKPLIGQVTTKICLALSSQPARIKLPTASATGFDVVVR